MCIIVENWWLGNKEKLVYVKILQQVLWTMSILEFEF